MDIDDARRFIAGAKWQYAKTMPKWPHEYTVRRPGVEFEDFYRFILSDGEFRKMLHWSRFYLDVDEWYYWTMGEEPKEARIINRARLPA